jgi:Tfp pilus assembly protein PilF
MEAAMRSHISSELSWQRPPSGRRIGIGALTVLAAAVYPWRAARAQAGDVSQLAVAESALAHSDLNRAVDLARSYTAHRRDDWHGWFVQGEATLRRGGSDNAYRVAAVIAFRHATELAPSRVEVWDGYGRAGLELGSADGESIVHEAFERVMAMEPLHPHAWESWLKAYRSHGDRERMQRILWRHDSVPEVRARIARLFVENEEYGRANAVLDSLLRLDPGQPEWLALRAQSAFESGDAATGYLLYPRAIARAGESGGEMLWQQAIGIATPGEIRAWEAGIAPADRPGFLRALWARRNPDLFTGVNQRVAEHFRRLRYARAHFQDTHPLTGYAMRPLTRALNARPGVGEQIFYQRCEARQVPGGPTRAADRARITPEMEQLLEPADSATKQPMDPYKALAIERWRHGIQPPGQMLLDPQAQNAGMLDMPYGRNVRDVDTTAAAMGYNLRTGLDDRGLTYLRFGPPEMRIIGSQTTDPFCSPLPDLEHWVYADIGDVRFFRPEAVNVGAQAGWATTGVQVFRPMNEPEFRATELAMTRNATSIRAPLGFGVWTAQFADLDSGVTDIAVVTTRGAVAAQLAGLGDVAGGPAADSLGVVVLRARPGAYLLTANALLSDTLGRQSQRLAVLPLGGAPALSDLVLAPAWPDTAVSRRAMLERVQRDLTFGAGETVRAYLEIYGLSPDANGHSRYRVSYQIYPTRDLVSSGMRDSLPGGITLDFERYRPLRGDAVGEWLDILPARIPAGRYLLRLEVTLPGRPAPIGRAQIGLDIRPE